jgi:phosphate starvation-inducible PhoH-like protein
MSSSYSSNAIRLEHLTPFTPLTENQAKAKKDWDHSANHLVLSGSAGTGKTFMGIRFAIEEILDKETSYEQLVIVRSIVPSRDIGFLPGMEEKLDPYKKPYQQLLTEIFHNKEAWAKLESSGRVCFEPTSFLRGTSYHNAIILVDEMQNLNFHELDTVATRVGNNCRMIMSGDYYQSDFEDADEKNGILKFMQIVEDMSKFEITEFTWKDIVRSDFVREYIMTKEMLGIK